MRDCWYYTRRGQRGKRANSGNEKEDGRKRNKEKLGRKRVWGMSEMQSKRKPTRKETNRKEVGAWNVRRLGRRKIEKGKECKGNRAGNRTLPKERGKRKRKRKKEEEGKRTAADSRRCI